MKKQIKMKNILAAFLAVVIVAAALCGCGAGGKSETTTGGASADNTASAAAENESATKATAEADSKSADDESESQEETTADGSLLANEVTIVYTNDIHSYVYNTVTDSDGNESAGLRPSNVAALVSDKKSEGKNVLLVDAGDMIQGTIYGSCDQGKSVMEIYKATGYAVSTVGNHEFDFGIETAFETFSNGAFPFISCNFISLETGETVLPEYEILECGDVKVAFIGITVPTTLTSTMPTSFMNDDGEFIYSFIGLESAEELYTCVQNAIDEVKDKADVIVALGHLGIVEDITHPGITSRDVIEHTTGLDAFIDGHSHNVVEGEKIKNKDGDEIILTQAGSYLSNIGVMTITQDKKVSTELISSYENADESIAAMEEELDEKIRIKMNQKIASLESTLYICNPENSAQRIVRSRETNLGDMVSDGVYWYFNEAMGQDCDLTIINGGAVRTQIEAGDITYLTADNVQPFGNQMCMIRASGQDILDALEMGVTVIGNWDDVYNSPAENGGFLQVAGMTYSINTGIASSVKIDSNGMFVSVDGEYRVTDVKVYNKETGSYEPLDLQKSYTIGGSNYILRNGGNGLSMFTDSELVVDFVGEDAEVFAAYLESFSQKDGYAYICTENSPLASYAGYMIDYANPYGAGRIAEYAN